MKIRNILLGLTMVAMLAGCEKGPLRESYSKNRSTKPDESSYEKRFLNDRWSRQEAEQRVKHERYEKARYHGMNDVMKNQFANMERMAEEGRRERAREYGTYQKFIEHGGEGKFQVISENHCNKCYRNANNMIDLP